MVESPGRITLWGIEIFVAAAEEKSISSTAKRLSASPSAISQQLTNLEEYKSDIKEEFEVVNEGIPDMKKIIQSKMFQHVDDIHGLNPNYLRITEAERNLSN